jgi:beta-phosphoglucomutase family hydrolase
VRPPGHEVDGAASGERRVAPEAATRDDSFAARGFEAVLFDLDGVLTSTAQVHARCWKEAFDAFLRTRSTRRGEPFQPFDADSDYRRFVDGRPHYDGVRTFLASRGIVLPEGTAASPSNEASVCGLGNRKDELFALALRAGKAQAYPGSVALVRHVRALGMKTAVVSSSHHCAEVLSSTGIEGLFDARVDGVVVDRLKLAGKPAADTYLHAAELLGVRPEKAVVIEDAAAGVQAGRAGGFGLVIGVDRGGNAQRLLESGADRIVSDLGELVPAAGEGEPG